MSSIGKEQMEQGVAMVYDRDPDELMESLGIDVEAAVRIALMLNKIPVGSNGSSFIAGMSLGVYLEQQRAGDES